MLDSGHAWVIPAPPPPIRLAAALRLLLSENGVVVIEGTSIHSEIRRSLNPHLIEPKMVIRPGTLYPRPKSLHIGATDSALNALEELVNTSAGPEICNHLYGYENNVLLLQWHDAFDDPIYIDGAVAPSVIERICAELRVPSPT